MAKPLQYHRDASLHAHSSQNLASPPLLTVFVRESELPDILSGNHQVAKTLQSNTSTRLLAEKLAGLFASLNPHDISHSPFTPLAVLVISQASDVDVWKAVFDVTNQNRTTPTIKQTTALPDTPMTYSSAAQQGSDQSGTALDPHLHDEIRHCRYYDVEGFFEKDFDRADWIARLDEVFNAAETRHSKGMWKHDQKAWTASRAVAEVAREQLSLWRLESWKASRIKRIDTSSASCPMFFSGPVYATSGIFLGTGERSRT